MTGSFYRRYSRFPFLTYQLFMKIARLFSGSQISEDRRSNFSTSDIRFPMIVHFNPRSYTKIAMIVLWFKKSIFLFFCKFDQTQWKNVWIKINSVTCTLIMVHFFNRALLHFMGTVLDGVITCVGGKCVELALRKACYVIKVLVPVRLYSEKLKKSFDGSSFSDHYCVKWINFSVKSLRRTISVISQS